MITRLELTNFRRHRRSVIDVDPSSRLILIEGGNGAGKSTVVEAILWALYGEGRDGRSNLDALIRRGGEDEGMQVALTFTRGERTYVATRGRRRGHSTATLTLDGALVAALPSAVTAEVTTLLGVDAAGFRLATYAQQKELDALASLQPARRGQMLSRLLGVDAVAQARTDAAGDARTARGALAALGAGDDLDEIGQRVQAARAEHDQYDALVCSLDEQLSTCQARLAALSEAESSWQAQRQARLVAVGAAEQIQTRRAHLVEKLDTLNAQGGSGDADDISAAGGDDAANLERLEADQARLRDRLEAARRDTELVERRRQLTADADALHRELGELIVRADRAQAASDRLAAGRERLEQLRAQLAGHEQRLAAAQAALAVATARLDDAEHACARVDAVGAQCDTCGQDVAADTLDELRARRGETAAQLRSDVAELAAEAAEVELLAADLRGQVGEADDALRAETQLASQLDELRARETHTLGRRQQLEAQAERLPSSAEQVEPLAERLVQLEGRILAARENRERSRDLAERATKKVEIEAELAELDARRAEVERHTTDPETEAAHLEHLDLTAQLTQLTDRRYRAAQSQAVAAERLAGLAATLEAARERTRRRRALEREAQEASGAAAVLDEVTERLTTQIRPALEAEVSQMLDRLSEGRYSAVRLDDNYDLWVHDDGGMQPLASLSGGEIDLVALAVRLALAAVVADRNSAQGPEFLILDECFGSQDASRQRAIVSALRQLDGMYSQVFVISHVPGVRDDVDRVIEVVAAVEGEVRTAEVS